MIHHHCEQRSEEWYALRSRCLLTASDAGAFLLKNDVKSKTARRKRCIELLTEPCYTGGDARLLELAAKERKALDYNLAIQRGIAFEPEALEHFQRVAGLTVDPIGLITTDDGLFGCSPDGLVGDDAGLELKVPEPGTHLGYVMEHIESRGMIADYLFQVHFSMAVSGRSVWHFFSYSVPFVDRGETMQHPYLHIPVKADAFTEQIRRGLDDLRSEFRATKAGLSAFHRSQMERRVA